MTIFHDSSSLQLYTLGRTALVRGPDQVVQAGKPLALLTYLRSGPGQSATRDQLVELFWADSPPERGRQALRQTLLRLGQVLGKGMIRAEREALTLTAPLWHDRGAFLDAVEAGDLERAVELYGGPFFPAFASPGALAFEHWAESERRHLAGLFQRAGEMEVRRLLATDARKALRIARRLRDEDPEQEAGWRLVLRSALAIPDLVQAAAEAVSLRGFLADADRPPEPSTALLLQECNRERPTSPGAPEPHPLTSELIGREQAFATLLNHWKETAAGKSRRVHILAEAGLGKSRLLGDFATRLRALGHQVVKIRAHPGEQQLAGGVAGDLVRSLAALPGAPGVGTESAAWLAGLEPSLLGRFGELRAVPMESNPYRAGVALADLCAAVAHERPTAVLLDDLHWTDPASRQILAAAAHRLGNSPLLLVTSARPIESGEPLIAGTATLTLEAWSPAECQAMVAALASADHSVLESLGQAVYQASGGSPLLALEALQHAFEREMLEVRSGTWWSADWPAAFAAIAQSDPIGARIRSLTSGPRQLLLVLALAGTQAPRTLLSDAAESISAGAALTELEVRGLAVRRGESWTIGHDEIAGAVLRLTPETQQHDTARRLGLRCLRTPDDAARLHCAIRLLRRVGDPAALEAVRRAFRLARRAGDRRAPSLIVASMVGETPTSTETRRLVRRLPVLERLGLRPIHAAGLAAGLGLVLLGAFALWPAHPPTPDAEFLVVTGLEAGNAHLGRVRLRRDRWDPGEPLSIERDVIEARVGSRWCSDMEASPDGRRLALTWCVADSGLTDIAVQEIGGAARRLTFTRGDDVHPSWSPDGRFLVFATARWSPRGEFTNLAILAVANGTVRRLTSGKDSDQWPVWSPDGTRIAFTRMRESDGVRVLCLTPVAGGEAVCAETGTEQPHRVVGWSSSSTLLLLRGGPAVLTLVERPPDPLEPGEVVIARNLQDAFVSRDGRWVAALPSGEWDQVRIFPTARPAQARSVRLDSAHRASPAFLIHQVPEYLDRLAVRPPLAPPIPGVAHQLDYLGYSALGHPVHLPPGMVTWQVNDTTVATVDRSSGLLQPRRPGRVVVTASAGGWRVDSAQLSIQPSPPQPLDSITWSAASWGDWRRFGSPEPVRERDPEGHDILLVNGDETYESGVVSNRKYPLAGGFGVEALVRTPVRDPRWQQLKIGLGTDVVVGTDGAGSQRGCAVAFPAGEGNVYHDSVAGGGGHLFGAGTLPDGAWHRLRIQVRPDAECEYRLDGQAIGLAPAALTPADSVQLLFYGQSVNTRIAVGPVAVWRGYRE